MTATVSDKLALAMTGLEPESVQALRATFESMFAQADEWCARAREIKVTSIEQRREMKLARESRLALRDIRVNAEHARKRLKEDSLRRGKAIDGIANIVKALIEPVEAYLLEQETFGERMEKAERDALRAARADMLWALGVQTAAMPAALGELDEVAWASVLADAKAAKVARDEAAVAAERLRAQAAKLQTERDAAAYEKLAKLDAEAAEQKKPTKAKYAALVSALQQIAVWTTEPHSAAIAQKVLAKVGEMAPWALPVPAASVVGPAEVDKVREGGCTLAREIQRLVGETATPADAADDDWLGAAPPPEEERR